jgi:hypothetical protein
MYVYTNGFYKIKVLIEPVKNLPQLTVSINLTAGRLLINVLLLPVRIRLGQKHVLPQQLLVVSPTLATGLSSINVFVLPSITDPFGHGIGGPNGGGIGGKHVQRI